MKGELAQAKLWSPLNQPKQPEPADALKQRKQSVPKSLCPIYSGKERVFISTSKGNVRLCNPGMKRMRLFFFFFFLEKSIVK